MRYDLVQITLTAYPVGYRIQLDHFRECGEFDGMWITPQNYSPHKGFRWGGSRFDWEGDPGDSLRDLEPHERTSDGKDAVFDRWAVRLRFSYPVHGVRVGWDNEHLIQDYAYNMGTEETFAPFVDAIFECLDPYIAQMDTEYPDEIKVLTAWSGAWYTSYDYEGYKDADFEYDLEGIVTDLVVHPFVPVEAAPAIPLMIPSYEE